MPKAAIIPFPQRWCRAWVICLVDGEKYRGEVHGDNTDGPCLTATGPRDLVMKALMMPHNRRGLPIIDYRPAPTPATRKGRERA